MLFFVVDAHVSLINISGDPGGVHLARNICHVGPLNIEILTPIKASNDGSAS